jgi:hypothetical protein
MPYYIDVVDTVGPGASTAPSQDSVNFNGPSFFYNDFLGPETEHAYTVALTFTGLKSSTVLPGGYTQADLAGHPGLFFCISTSAGNGGNFVPANHFFNGNNFFSIKPGVPTTVFKYIFKTPKVLSSGADRYQMSIGPGYIVGLLNSVPTGWALQYRDDVNAGNWTFSEFLNSIAQTTANSSRPVVANTWMRLEVTIAGVNVSATITTCGTNDTTSVFSGVSPQLNAGTPVSITPCAATMWRVLSTGIDIGFPVDYFSMTTATTGRVL